LHSGATSFTHLSDSLPLLHTQLMLHLCWS
jgi:hypothetical protein